LDLHLDIFQPQDDTLKKHPLVMMVHGGAFYFGSKDDASITSWCRHLASMGYVTASIDYRIGFFPAMVSIERAGYRAVQDAHAAMRYLVSHQEEYSIDTSMIFVGGTSAGAITALNLAFMTNENRPKFTHGDLFRPDLGDIDTCGNAIKADFRIRGLIDMWGAMPDTTLLQGRDIPILAFHGDADNIVPYGHDYPFGIAGPLKTMLVEPMFGSSCIVDRANKLGHQARLVTFSGFKHSPHVDPETKAFNDNFFIIRDMMSEFFHDIIVPHKLEIDGDDSHYYIRPYPLKANWQVEGGVILSNENNTVEVAWIKNAPQRSITVSALLPYGVGLTETKVYQ
jgi:pimeloyl-ACP methyl ester carboxylesterase